MENRKSLFGIARVLVILVAILIIPMLAQAQSAGISGTVTDPTGAVVPGATVTVVNEATSATKSAETASSGTYTIQNLPPGIYDISVEKSGLAAAKFTAVTLTVDQTVTLDAKMTVGSTAQTVTVEGTNVTTINTSDAQVSNVIDSKQIQELPLILRDPYQLILLTPGSTQTNTGLGGFSINGAREQQNNFQLDGTNNNDPGVPGSGLVTLNPDSTEEFRVISDNYLPEFGRNSGAVIDIVTRSGTNNLHGDLIYFGRWSATGARDFFDPNGVGPENPYERNTFGASIGGPLIKNKLFYFGNYEGNRFTTTVPEVAVIPDAGFITGNFTVVDTSSGSPVSVPIDVSSAVAANNRFGLALDPQTQELLNFYGSLGAVPNGGPRIQGLSDDFNFGQTEVTNNNNYLAKVDFNINSRNTLSVRYSANKGIDNGAEFNTLPGIGGVAFKGLTQSTNAHLATSISPTLQSDLFATANRTSSKFTCNGTAAVNALDGAGVDVFGNGRDWALPAFTGIGCQVQGDTDVQIDPFGTYTVGDNVTWTKGRHTIKFGFELEDNYDNGQNSFGGRSAPDFAIFTNTRVSALQGAPGITDPTIQDAIWGLLGGVFNESQSQFFDNTGTRVSSDERGFRERDLYGFVQDQFKIKPNLTLSIGLRYEWSGVPWVVNNELTSASPADLSGPPPIMFTQVTRGGANPLYTNDVKGFEPRVGFAWDPFKDGKTSIRAGFGYFRDRNFFNITGDTRANPPLELPFVNSVYTGAGPATSADQISSVALPTTQPAPPSFLPEYAEAFPATITPNFHVAYVQQRNFGIQRDLGHHFTLEVNYVGNKGNRLLRVVDGNPPIPSLVAQLRAYCHNPFNAFGCVDTPTNSTVQGFNLYAGAEFGVLPFDAINNLAAFHANVVSSVANSNYNGLQTTLTRQLSRGVSFQANYTWSHAIDDASDPFRPQATEFVFPGNSFELKREKGNSSFDVRHRLVFNYTAELPVGRGKDHLNNGVVGKVLEGWTWSGIGTFQSGFPIDIFASGIDSDGTGALQRASFNPTPTVVPIPDGLTKRTQTGPNVGLFMLPLFGGPGTVGRNVFTGPGYGNFDTVLTKTTRITERFSVETRFECYNLFNHPNFQQPDDLITDGSFFGQSFGEVGRNDGTTGARQLQFGAKLRF